MLGPQLVKRKGFVAQFPSMALAERDGEPMLHLAQRCVIEVFVAFLADQAADLRGEFGHSCIGIGIGHRVFSLVADR